jgi:arylsulfatase A
MRLGDWKILAHLTQPGLKSTPDILPSNMENLKSAELTTFELYNLRDDVAEATNLADKEQQRLKVMSAQLRKLYREVRDEGPTWPAWTCPRYESQRIKWPDWKPVRNRSGRKKDGG